MQQALAKWHFAQAAERIADHILAQINVPNAKRSLENQPAVHTDLSQTEPPNRHKTEAAHV
jgi:hypothetical protein